MDNILTIKDIRKTKFNFLYEKLILNEKLNSSEINALLKLAIIFINEEEENIKNLGYRVLLIYSNLYQDYKVLFDIAINNGFIPISKFIDDKIYDETEKLSFFNLFISSYMENYKKNDIYLTYQQQNINSFLSRNNNSSISIIAPTSYGKSDIIIDTIKKNSNENICVVVPTKALLEQTKKRLLHSNTDYNFKVITHPEMYNSKDKTITAVLTQERLLRLLKKNKKLSFNTVFIDEAHNIFSNDERNILLASTLIILNKRNEFLKLIFLTPFLMDSNNLKLAYTNFQIKEFKVTEYIKSERLYLYDFREGKDNILKLYDQFLDNFIELKDNKYTDEIDLIINKSTSKNIVYFNRPIIIEEFTRELILRLPEVKSEKITKICAELKLHLHKDYYLIDAIKHGVIYHHGSIPSYIRLYIEYLFKEEKEIKYVITSSTLLEGINIPAETLFILNNMKGTGKLSPSQFKNLIGRVSRFNEIFSSKNKNMKLLEPQIYLIGSKYYHKTWPLEKFIRDSMKIDNKIIDNYKNPLLTNVNIDDTNFKNRTDAENFIANFEEDIIENRNIKIAKTEIGKLCFENNIVEINIIEEEDFMNNIVLEYKKKANKINMPSTVLEAISDIFVNFLKNEKNNNLKRLQNEKARTFYSKFLEWKMESTSYNEMINSFLFYWKYLIDNEKETLIYVDSKWGEETRGDGFKKMWVDILYKNKKEKVNLSIVRINDEQEFLDNVLFKFIDILYELELIEESFFNNIKYGTEDIEKIILMKNGISFSLTHLLIDDYKKYIHISIENEYFKISNSIITEMKKNKENEIMLFEVEQYTGRNNEPI
jgi:superfamily II DNA or RNA helicase